MLSLAVVRETIVAIVASSKETYLQDRRYSSNVVNRTSSDTIQYKSTIAKFKRESLQHKAKEATFMRE